MPTDVVSGIGLLSPFKKSFESITKIKEGDDIRTWHMRFRICESPVLIDRDIVTSLVAVCSHYTEVIAEMMDDAIGDSVLSSQKLKNYRINMHQFGYGKMLPCMCKPA